MRWRSAYQTELGQRKVNEDALFADDTLGLYIVADGVGGNRGGHVASEITVTDFVARIQTAPADSVTTDKATLLREALEATNLHLLDQASNHAEYPKMSTTIVTAWISDGVAYIGHAGDSRVYLVREGKVRQLTEDDVFGGWGKLPGFKKKSFEDFLVKSMGQNPPLDPTVSQLSLQPNDWLFLCTDGLWRHVDPDALLANISATSSPDLFVQALLEKVKTVEGADNATLIAINILED